MDNEPMKKKKKGSKNRKKGWRKNVDVEDVEQHLEDNRRDERTGGSAADIESKDLFFVEKEVKNLAPSKKSKHTSEDEEHDEEVYVPKKQQFMEQLYREKEKELKRKKAEKSKKAVNVWGQEVLTVKDAYLDSTVKKAKVKPNTVGRGKLEGVGAVLQPHPGSSYNPDFDSHQDLLGKAHSEEEEKLKAAVKLNMQVKMVSVQQLKKQGDIWLKEMSEGLNKKKGGSDDDSSDEEEDEDETNGLNTKRKKERKTGQQRRRTKLRRTQEKERFEAKQLNQRLHDVFRLRTMNKEIRQAEEQHALRIQEKVKQQEEIEKTRTKRLSKYKFQEDGTTYQLSEDLSGSLRELRPEGNLIKDRYRSLQRRNIIEVRRPVVPHRRYKRKVVTRRSYLAPTIRDFNPTRKKGT